MQRVTLIVPLLLTLAAPALARDLEIFFIDVEGGQSTLIVTPAGQSLLIDAGYGGRDARDAERIMAAAREAHIDHIDYLLITHFHNDHVGGVAELADRIPILRFVDYGSPLGTDRMATNGYRVYEPVRGENLHLEPGPGDRLPLEGIEVDIVSAAGILLSKPLRGAGQPNSACATLEDQPDDGTENFRSIGMRLQFGAFRFVDLGDLSGNTLGSLVCPFNLLGQASAYLIAHHGNYDSNVPAVLAALRPQVSIMNNGPTKGGSPDSFKTLLAQPDMDLWQLHESRNRGAQNAPDAYLANVDDGITSYWIKLTAKDDGRFEVLNSRTGFVKKYWPSHSN
ncbi:MAG TPA: MBL fold metallo-hydrolase [Vicinamibacterales bacterium]|jgi:beta-lactamase superfamily II metal-dependent hydrolase